MGRRRRKKVVKIIKRTLPKFFICPRCGGRSIHVTISPGEGNASVRCSLCGLTGEVPAPPGSQPVDVYCKFSDMFYARKIA
ncbi:hypothetical protein [Candidatus Hecatella orcuttiae]|uniref:hypothetical protein n=1 Tax=Candidatus Hecatella orcuttiae TaxID=1935119 RepID=UPI002867BE12|nr:hypothetical protein [Candidatus Hecatella orcuttiae]